MKFESILNSQVNMEKVDLDSIKPWISKRITDILNHEDEVVIEYVFNQLEPQYPNPKEIQANLSGFFSLKNARIFLADLWQKLLDSMDSSVDRYSSRMLQSVNDKNKDYLPKLPSPEIVILEPRKNHERKRSEHREDNRRYRSRRSYSRSDYSRSVSYHRRYRERRRSSSRYRRSRYADDHWHHRSRSSSGHTPYTRYSDYTNDRDHFSERHLSPPSSGTSSSSSSSTSSSKSSSKSSVFTDKPSLSHSQSQSSSSSPSAASQMDTDTNSPIDVQLYETGMSDLDTVECVSRHSKSHDELDHNNKAMSNTSDKSNISQSERSGNMSIEIISTNCERSNGKAKSISRSHSTLSNYRCPESQSSSSDSVSSSEYTIEYVEKRDLTDTEPSCDESDEDCDSDTEYEWVTIEEYTALHNSVVDDDSYSRSKSSNQSSSGESSSSSGSSDISIDDVVWLEQAEIDSDDGHYLRL